MKTPNPRTPDPMRLYHTLLGSVPLPAVISIREAVNRLRIAGQFRQEDTVRATRHDDGSVTLQLIDERDRIDF